MKCLIPFFFLFIYNNCSSQSAKAIPVSIDKNILFAKIAWLNDKGFCVVEDKLFNGTKFPHLVLFYDSTGKNTYRSFRFNTPSPSQGEYFFALKQTCLYMEKSKNDMGGHMFYISASVTGNGILNDTLKEIFYIREGKENKLLSSPDYNFHVYPGTSHNKAILAYNNNYKNPIPEGFRFKIIDSDINLSAEDTLNLPYPDRECNINDVIYDDTNDLIYLLCDHFIIEKGNKTHFEKSFVGVYNLKMKTYNEISLNGISFYKNKIQHIFNNGIIGFSGIYPDPLSSSSCTASFALFKDTPLTFLNGKQFTLDSNLIQGFYNKEKKLDRDYINPVNFIMDKNGDLEIGWTKWISLNQLKNISDNKGEIIAASGIMLGLVGALVAAAATANQNTTYKDFGRALSLKYSARNSILKQDTVFSSIVSEKYYSHFLANIILDGESAWILNKPNIGNVNSKTSIYCLQPGDNNIENEKTSSSLKSLPANIINAGSLYVKGDKNYFIGEYDSKNSTLENKDKDQYYLIVME